MKIPALPTSLCLLIGGMAATAVADKPTEAVMRFENNDQIAGSLKALGNDSLVWESDILAEPATFRLKHVLDLTLDAQNREPDSSHVAILTLRNGDEVHGQLDSITEDTIAIRTWFAGPMAFNRLMVSKVQIEGGGSLYFRGPTSSEGWQMVPEDCWEYRRQAFISRKIGSIARDKILPEECTLSFTVQRKGSSMDLKLMLFSQDTSSSQPRSGYELSFQRNSIYLRSGRSRNFLGSGHSRELTENDKSRIEIKASRKTGQVLVLIDGNIVMSDSDPNIDPDEFGSGLHFIAGNNEAIRISEIEIGPWDSQAEALPQANGFRRMHQPVKPKQEEVDEDEGRMKLANGDSLDGEVETIEDGMITLKTPLGIIRLPVERFRSLNLEGLGKEEAKAESKDIKAYFADGSTLVFRLEGVEGDRIIGASQNYSTDSKWGTASFDLSAISRIEFDPHHMRSSARREEIDW